MKTIDRLLLLVIAGVLAGTYYFTNSHVPSPVEQKSVSVVGVGEARKGLSELGVSEQLKTEVFRTSPDYDWKD